MRSEQETKQKLEEMRDRHERLMETSGESPCKPDGSTDHDHIAAVSVNGGIGMLEWVLEEDE